MTVFYNPSRGLWVLIAGKWYRYRCGRRFGHFPLSGDHACGRCGKHLL